MDCHELTLSYCGHGFCHKFIALSFPLHCDLCWQGGGATPRPPGGLGGPNPPPPPPFQCVSGTPCRRAARSMRMQGVVLRRLSSPPSRCGRAVCPSAAGTPAGGALAARGPPVVAGARSHPMPRLLLRRGAPRVPRAARRPRPGHFPPLRAAGPAARRPVRAVGARRPPPPPPTPSVKP